MKIQVLKVTEIFQCNTSYKLDKYVEINNFKTGCNNRC